MASTTPIALSPEQQITWSHVENRITALRREKSELEPQRIGTDGVGADSRFRPVREPQQTSNTGAEASAAPSARFYTSVYKDDEAGYKHRHSAPGMPM